MNKFLKYWINKKLKDRYDKGKKYFNFFILFFFIYFLKFVLIILYKVMVKI